MTKREKTMKTIRHLQVGMIRLLLTALLLPMALGYAHAQDTGVTLTVRRVKQVDNPDGWGGGDADYYARVRVDGVDFPATGHVDNRADVSPFWTFRRIVATGSVVPIHIEIWDHDTTSGDDHCDVDPASGARNVDILYNTATNQITGDVRGLGGQILHVRGEGDRDRAEIWFTVNRSISSLPPTRLPERWASDLKIKLDWTTSAGDARLQRIENCLAAFNNRLYDCTDGQWRVGRFLIHDATSELDPEGQGVGHFHEHFPHPREHGHASGRPNSPEHFHLGLDRLDNVGPASYGGAMLHEFLHSWTGVKDEYEVSAGGAATMCPPNMALANESHGCVMWQPWSPTFSELCRPLTHNPNTEQGNDRGMDCYSWLKKVMDEAGIPGFQVPAIHIPGPTAAPPLRFVYVTIHGVQQIDNPDGWFGGDADYYAKVTIDRAAFEKSTHVDDLPIVFLGWRFGLGYSSNAPRSIPIRIELWDHDVTSADDQCDINPRSGAQSLNLWYNSVTGRITGDATGASGAWIYVRGEGDSDRAGMWFTISER